MWILIFLFFLAVLILGWTLFGYYVWIFLLGILKKEERPAPKELVHFPSVSLIVPTYDEEEFILEKIENLKSIDYPKDKLEILFVDGGSSDKTLNIIDENKESYMRVLSSPAKGKINQLNFALGSCKSEFILVSDADGLISSNTIKEIIKEFNEDKNTYLVGVCTYPKSSYAIDRYYWVTQNKGRLLETNAFTSSIVVAICYSFRRGLIDKFPQDVVADDIFISYFANNLGYKVSYIDSCYAQELRGPRNTPDFVAHKFRKANAFLKESLRFMYKISEMSPVWKIIFLTKIFQIVLVPWLFLSYLVLGGALVSLGRLDVFFIGSFLLLVLIFITHRVFVSVKKEKEDFPFSVVLETFLLANFILFVTGISFIFFRQDSSYKKINEF